MTALLTSLPSHQGRTGCTVGYLCLYFCNETVFLKWYFIRDQLNKQTGDSSEKSHRVLRGGIFTPYTWLRLEQLHV